MCDWRAKAPSRDTRSIYSTPYKPYGARLKSSNVIDGRRRPCFSSLTRRRARNRRRKFKLIDPSISTSSITESITLPTTMMKSKQFQGSVKYPRAVNPIILMRNSNTKITVKMTLARYSPLTLHPIVSHIWSYNVGLQGYKVTRLRCRFTGCEVGFEDYKVGTLKVYIAALQGTHCRVRRLRPPCRFTLQRYKVHTVGFEGYKVGTL